MLTSPGVESEIAPRAQRVLRSLCHAIRQPLTAITARAELLEDGVFGAPPPEQRAELASLQEDCARLSVLVQDFCDLVRGDIALAPADDADLAAVARAELARIEPRAARALVHLELSAEPRAPIAGASTAQLHQLVARLLEQALRFAPRRTNVLVAVTREASWWRLLVEDEGPCPLDVDELRRDLDRCERPDDLHGLAPELALAEAWVHALGGRFALRRIDGCGLAVSALLPAAELRT
jgi:K+-sensing histidine kinase KdpD